MSAQLQFGQVEEQWALANREYLLRELACLRLRLKQRALWLRQVWQSDPLREYQGLVTSDARADLLLAGDDGFAQAVFHRDDPQAAELGAALAAAERDAEAHRHALTDAGVPPAIETLTHLFGLTAFERAVLLMCLAPELDGSFERLFGYVQDDATRKYATPLLALSLFGGEGREWLAARDSFLPDAPLRRYEMVSLDAVGPANPLAVRAIRLDDRMADFLLGVNRMDERLAEVVQPVPAAPVPPGAEVLLERLGRWIEALPKGEPWPVLNLLGAPGSGKVALARALCRRVGLQLVRLHPGRVPAREPDRRQLLRVLEREAVLLQWAVYLDLAEASEAPPADAVEGMGVFRIVGSRQRWNGDEQTLAVPVPKPAAADQRALWSSLLGPGSESLNGSLDALVQQFDFGPRAIARAAGSARAMARLRDPRGDAFPGDDELWEACRRHSGAQLDALAQRIVPCNQWEDIVLRPDALRQVRDIGAQVAHRALVYERWGFGAKMSRGRGITAMFAGPSGTGKTMAAEILANHLNLDLYRIDLSAVVSKYIGETEKNLSRLFDAAEQSGAILFFDEADALFGKRTEIKEGHDRYANIEINYLLQRMEDYRGLAVLATNKKALLDEAFLRRLRFVVEFPMPDAVERIEIWRKAFPAAAAVEGLDYAFLSRLEISGASIKNIALNAAFLAADGGGPVGMDHVMLATRREYAKMERLVLESEFGAYYAKVRP